MTKLYILNNVEYKIIYEGFFFKFNFYKQNSKRNMAKRRKNPLINIDLGLTLLKPYKLISIYFYKSLEEMAIFVFELVDLIVIYL